ncbi:hypothetical protein SNE40_023274 [Patella caerulea]|uniref:Galactosylgalactosylxylosylprotein 3-beta-glucuronosyltransferase n=2 Tax=Patella caerulea TaxID=87958 RepID=A0AAN8G9U9_PATCE
MISPRFKKKYLFLLFFVFQFFLMFYISWCPAEDLSRMEKLVLIYQKQIMTQEIELKKLKVTRSKIYYRTEQKVLPKYIKDLPYIYAITPTYTRLEQKAELTRLSQTLLHIPNFHWIVIEDATTKTELVTKFLKNSGLNYTHLNALTPKHYKLEEKDPNWLKPRGVLQRNAGLEWIVTNQNSKSNGVIYFMDDDNTYSLKLFDEIRFTEKVSVWPVGLSGGLRFESPIVTNNEVTNWFVFWKPERPFPMDMAGFAINLKFFLQYPEARFSLRVQRGYQESTLLSQLHVKLNDLEPKANDCKEILVWHTRTEKTKLKNEDKLKLKYGHGSDLSIEV